MQSVGAGRPRDERRRKTRELPSSPEKAIGVNRVIRVVSSGDLSFALEEANATEAQAPPAREAPAAAAAAANLICMTSSGFALALLLLLGVLLASCGLSAYLFARLRPLAAKAGLAGKARPKAAGKPACCYS